jgi:heavy metal translocating P-type ATPase
MDPAGELDARGVWAMGMIACGYCGGAVDEAGGRYCCYGCRVLGEGGSVARGGHGGASGWWRVGVGVLVSGQTMLLGLAWNLDGSTGPERWWVHGWLMAGALVALGLLGPSLVREACRCARRGRVAVEGLFIVGALAAFAASLQATITGRGAVYYEVVAILVTVHAVGKSLTATARARALEEAGRWEQVFATARRVGATGLEEPVPVEALREGDRIRVGLGGAVVMGGRVARGQAWVQESALTGEALPVVKRAGDWVRAGSVAMDGELEVLVEPSREADGGGRRELEALMRALREARETVEDTMSWGRASRWASWFLPMVLAVALATLALSWGRVGAEAAVYRSLSVVLVACPCALGLSVPLGLWSALSVLATRGVCLRRASAVEALAAVDHVCVDKTGTLTGLEPVLVDFVAAGDEADRQRWLAWMAAVEVRAGGVWGKAFAGVACEARARVEVRDVSWVAGAGVEAEVREEGGTWHRVRVGRRDWAGGEGVDSWEEEAKGTSGDARIGLAVDGTCMGLALLRERRLPGWEELVGRWEAMGCRVEVLSGDAMGRLEAFGCGGRVRCRGGMTPEEKAMRVREIQAGGGRVLFVGDGLNDGLALRAANVGLAVSEGTSAARALADGEVGWGRLDRVVEAMRVARRAMRAVEGSLLFALGYNLLGMGLAAAGVLHPAWAALLMTGSSVVVAWRAVRGAGCADDAAGGRRGGADWVVAGSMAAQAPLAAWLGAMGWVQAAGMAAACLSGAAWILAGTGTHRWWRMSLGMLGTGNLMMLVGWWADAGFGPVMAKGVCLCCQAHHYFEAGGSFPWMWAGMLAGGLPWMREAVSGGRGAWGWAAWFLGMAWLSVAMVAGMAWGGGLVVRWLPPLSPWQFVAAWCGMTLGMLGGMGLACAAVEACRVAWHRRIPGP